MRNLIVTSVQLVCDVHQMIAKVHACAVQSGQRLIHLLTHPDLWQLASQLLEQQSRPIELSLGFNTWWVVCCLYCYYNNVFFLKAQLFCNRCQ